MRARDLCRLHCQARGNLSNVLTGRIYFENFNGHVAWVKIVCCLSTTSLLMSKHHHSSDAPACLFTEQVSHAATSYSYRRLWAGRLADVSRYCWPLSTLEGIARNGSAGQPGSRVGPRGRVIPGRKLARASRLAFELRRKVPRRAHARRHRIPELPDDSPRVFRERLEPLLRVTALRAGTDLAEGP
jgi:hypothetical protein